MCMGTPLDMSGPQAGELTNHSARDPPAAPGRDLCAPRARGLRGLDGREVRTVAALLTNKAYAYPTRGARRRRKPTILTCLPVHAIGTRRGPLKKIGGSLEAIPKLQIAPMLLGQLEVPQPLLDAHRDGGLVVFVGAGVSRPAPEHPDFRRLAELIGLQAGVQVRRLEPLDVYLGRAEADPIRCTNAWWREIVDSGRRRCSSTTPSSASSGPPTRFGSSPRTSTRQLWNAASGRWSREPREYVAPALPFGGDMRGIVYLHGAAHDSARDLVVTDRDFGLAYLTRGHATRFLLDLYAGNTVLFVGYSHSDPILTYLARGLAPGVGRRYALSHPRDRERWQSLSVSPIEIPSGRGVHRHLALARGLRASGESPRDGVLRAPTPAEGARPAWATEPGPRGNGLRPGADRGSRHGRLLCREATDAGWLTWLAEEPLFRRIFANPQSTEGAVQPGSVVLARRLLRRPEPSRGDAGHRSAGHPAPTVPMGSRRPGALDEPPASGRTPSVDRPASRPGASDDRLELGEGAGGEPSIR